MPKFVVIEDGTVANIVNSEPDYAAAQGWMAIAEDLVVRIGWLYVNGQFIDNTPPEPPPAPTPPTKEQLMDQINSLLAQVQALE